MVVVLRQSALLPACSSVGKSFVALLCHIYAQFLYITRIDFLLISTCYELLCSTCECELKERVRVDRVTVAAARLSSALNSSQLPRLIFIAAASLTLRRRRYVMIRGFLFLEFPLYAVKMAWWVLKTFLSQQCESLSGVTCSSWERSFEQIRRVTIEGGPKAVISALSESCCDEFLLLPSPPQFVT